MQSIYRTTMGTPPADGRAPENGEGRAALAATPAPTGPSLQPSDGIAEGEGRMASLLPRSCDSDPSHRRSLFRR
jgi:hypothetical protein